VSLDELHDQIVGTDVVERTDIGMVQGRNRAHLSLEASREPLVQDLDGHVPAKAAIACAVDASHTSDADEVRDLVGAETGSDERLLSVGAVSPEFCRGGIEEGSRRGAVEKERFHFLQEDGIAGTLFLHEPLTFVTVESEGSVIQRFDLAPPFR
jgi:hypothetical protein